MNLTVLVVGYVDANPDPNLGIPYLLPRWSVCKCADSSGAVAAVLVTDPVEAGGVFCFITIATACNTGKKMIFTLNNG